MDELLPAAAPDPVPEQSKRERMEQAKEEFELLTKRRQEILEREKMLREKRKSDVQVHRQEEAGHFREEIAATKERAVGREEWRQGQHEQKRAAEAEKKHQAEVRKAEEAARKKREEEATEKKEYMENLHRLSVQKKVKEKRASIALEDEKQQKHINQGEELLLREIDQETDRSLQNLAAEMRRKGAGMKAIHDRRRSGIEEKARTEKADAVRTMKGVELSQKKMQIESTRKRELLFLDEQIATETGVLQAETKRLKDEILREADRKRALEKTRAAHRRQESTAHREGAERWISGGEEKKKEL